MPLSDLTEPARLDLKLVAGDSFSRTVRLQEQNGDPIDLTGLTGRAQIRDRPKGKLLAEFTVTIPTPTNGEITFSLDTTQTRALPGAGVWDLELDGGTTNTHTIVSGDVKVIPDVTVAP
jgi:hypothetical protein